MIGMEAVDNPAFLRWLHRKCLRAELVGIALLVAYFLIVATQCEDEDGTVESRLLSPEGLDTYVIDDVVHEVYPPQGR